MRLHIPATLLGLLQLTHAFYPYIRTDDEPSQHKPRTISRPRTVPDSDLRVSIRRLPYKRASAFNIIPPQQPTQENSVGVAQDGSDYSYFCAFKFGTSNKEYYMLLDSAASNTWVMSSDCKTTACGVHSLFGTAESTSLKLDQTPFSVVYGTGSVKGVQGSDTVKIGDMSVPLQFGLATDVSNEFSSFPMDGIVGLGRPDTLTDSSNGIKGPALMDVLVSEKIIDAKVFALDLWRASDGGSNDGVINFGKPDSSRYTGDLNFIPAIKSSLGFWEVAVKDAGVDRDIAGLPGRTAIIDSGTSYVLMPYDDALQLHELITGYKKDGSEGFTVPCDTKAKVQFTLGSTTYDIDPRDYVGHMVGTECASNIIGRQTFGPKQWLVGDVFLKNVYTVFDFDQQRVGFGIKSDGPSSGGTGGSPAAGTETAASVSPSKSSSTPVLLPAGAQSASAAAASMSATADAAASSASRVILSVWGLLGLGSGLVIALV